MNECIISGVEIDNDNTTEVRCFLYTSRLSCTPPLPVTPPPRYVLIHREQDNKWDVMDGHANM